ncbi:MAG: metallophosphoesterase [Candidatus Jordarchaeales archaeon]|nr:metallophosphoesterase [Candidatus Jordarchaeia archaeon]
MIIGVMSDSHDNMEAIRRAVEFFNSEGVELVVHAGDIISPFTIRAFRELACPIKAVTGNNDGDFLSLRKLFDGKGEISSFFISLEMSGVKIAVNHGHYPDVLEALITSGKYDVVICGHTHEQVNKKMGSTLVVNPGETCGYLTGKRSVAVLDLREIRAEIIEI